jgi:hypothetical protein
MLLWLQILRGNRHIVMRSYELVYRKSPPLVAVVVVVVAVAVAVVVVVAVAVAVAVVVVVVVV